MMSDSSDSEESSSQRSGHEKGMSGSSSKGRKSIMDMVKASGVKGQHGSARPSDRSKSFDSMSKSKNTVGSSSLDPDALKKIRDALKKKKKSLKEKAASGGAIKVGGNKGDNRVKKVKVSIGQKKKKKSAPLEVLSNSKIYDPEFLERKRKERKKEKEREGRDPRFSDLHGNLDVCAVANNYAFLDEMRKQEREELLEVCTKGKKKNQTDKYSQMNIEEATRKLQQISDQDKRRDDVTAFREKKKALQQKEKDKVLSGRTAYYHSTNEIRKLVRKDKLDKLGEKSREKILAKREKRKAGEEKKWLVGKKRAE